MINGKTVLAVIPARGGSKRFPGKNIAPFRGLPMIEWTIRAAQRSEYIDTLICSTDSAKIEAVALTAGCVVLPRPTELATDTASSEDVLRHAVIAYPSDIVVLLQPTSPLRRTEDIDAYIKLFHVEPVISYSENEKKNGAVYVGSAEWLKNHTFMDEHTSFIMADDRSLDVDYKEDVGL